MKIKEIPSEYLISDIGEISAIVRKNSVEFSGTEKTIPLFSKRVNKKELTIALANLNASLQGKYSINLEYTVDKIYFVSKFLDLEPTRIYYDESQAMPIAVEFGQGDRYLLIAPVVVEQ